MEGGKRLSAAKGIVDGFVWKSQGVLAPHRMTECGLPKSMVIVGLVRYESLSTLHADWCEGGLRKIELLRLSCLSIAACEHLERETGGGYLCLLTG